MLMEQSRTLHFQIRSSTHKQTSHRRCHRKTDTSPSKIRVCKEIRREELTSTPPQSQRANQEPMSVSSTCRNKEAARTSCRLTSKQLACLGVRHNFTIQLSLIHRVNRKIALSRSCSPKRCFRTPKVQSCLLIRQRSRIERVQSRTRKS